MRRAALAFLALGLFFALMTVVYGYFFGVWNQALGVMRGDKVHVTKFGELALFTFLAVGFHLAAIATALLDRRA